MGVSVAISLGVLGVVFCLAISSLHGEETSDPYSIARNRTMCAVAKTCRECMQIDETCVWCSEQSYTGYRCDNVEGLKRQGCPVEFRITTIANIKNIPLPPNQPNRMDPPGVNVVIRPGPASKKEIKIDFSYTMPDIVPIDLYILFDGSNPNGFIRDAFKDELTQYIGTVTTKHNNSRVALGAFVDKPVPPFSMNVLELDLENVGPSLARPYSFLHIKNFTKDAAAIRSGLDLIPEAKSDDVPESLLEALLQILDCGSPNVIDWRREARRLIIAITDSPFHFAGSGRLGGLIRPYDGKCHLKLKYINGQPMFNYEGETIFDYPSVSQLEASMQRMQASIMFGTFFTARCEIDHLVAAVPDTYAESFFDKADRIFKFVDSKATELERTADMQIISIDNLNVPIKELGLKLYTWCSNANRASEPQEGGKCTDVNPNTRLNFRVTLSLTSCEALEKAGYRKINKDGQYEIPLRISPKGLPDSESFYLTVQVACRCSCEQTQISSQCSDKGYLQCGECSCLSGYYGAKCNCGYNIEYTESQKECRNRAIEDSPCLNQQCCSRGKCSCGDCDCENVFKDSELVMARETKFGAARYSKDANAAGASVIAPQQERILNLFQYNSVTAKYSGYGCQCDDNKCHLDETLHLFCSGQGRCKCGKCECNKGFSGQRCECQTDQTPCIAPDSKKLCSGPDHGTCQCGKCECLPRFQGDHCEHCKGCEGACTKLKACVLCLAYDYKGDGSEKPTKEECLQLCRNERVFVDESQLRGLNLDEDPFGDKRDPFTTTTRAYALTTTRASANSSEMLAKLSTRQTALLLRKLKHDEYENERRRDAGASYIYEACDIIVDTPRSCNSQFYYVKHFNKDLTDSEPYFSVTARHPWNCPSAFNPLWIVIGVVIFVFLLGLLLLLLWRVIVSIYDNRQFERLKQEELEAEKNMSDNPWYQGATNRFQNPSYAGMR